MQLQVLLLPQRQMQGLPLVPRQLAGALAGTLAVGASGLLTSCCSRLRELAFALLMPSLAAGDSSADSPTWHTMT